MIGKDIFDKMYKYAVNILLYEIFMLFLQRYKLPRVYY